MLIAIFVLLVTFTLPVFSYELRKNRSLIFGYWFVILLHQIVAFTNAFLFTTLGAGADASAFHKIGVGLAQSGEFSFSIGAKFYTSILGIVYWLFGSSHFLGDQLSVLAFALSCIVLLKILRQLDLLDYQLPVLLLFGALPTMVLLGSITMRESYQVLFFMLAVYFGMKMLLKGGINRNFIALILSAFVMGLFHKGLIVYMSFLIVLFMVFSLDPAIYLWRIKKLRLLLLLTLPILFMGLLLMVKLQIPGVVALSALANMNVGEYILDYRETAAVARATYAVVFDLSSSFAFILSTLVLYLYYLFAPFPWQVGGVLDAYAATESIMRMILLYYAIKHWRNAYGSQRRLLGLMLILFFSMTFLWAMGTTNYGTAMRHHMLTWWILVVVGLPPLIESMRRFFLSSVVNRYLFPASAEKNN